jgi:hypothetical protein
MTTERHPDSCANGHLELNMWKYPKPWNCDACGWSEDSEKPIEVKAGQLWRWMNCAIFVRRVAKDKSWADIKAFPISGKPWSKRQPLPMEGAMLMKKQWR